MPWIAATLAALVGIGGGVMAGENGCFDAIPEAGREGSATSSGGFLFYETCTTTTRTGEVIEADVVHGWSIAFAVPMAVGAWFTFAGLVRRVRPRLAVAAVAASVVGLLIALAIFFA